MRLINTPEGLVDYQIEYLQKHIQSAEYELEQHTEEARSLSSELKALKETLARFKEHRESMGKK